MGLKGLKYLVMMNSLQNIVTIVWNKFDAKIFSLLVRHNKNLMHKISLTMNKKVKVIILIYSIKSNRDGLVAVYFSVH